MFKSSIPLFFFFSAIVQFNFAQETENAEEDYSLLDLFVSAQSSTPCETEFNSLKSCLSDVTANYNGSSETRWSDNETMISILEDAEKANCFVPSDCANIKIAKYIYDGIIYLGEKIYQQGFGCIKKIESDQEALQETFKHCINVVLLGGQATVESVSIGNFAVALRPVTECFFHRQQQCSWEERTALIDGFNKALDLVSAYINPDKVLKELNINETDISKKEYTAVYSFFATWI